MLKQHLRYSPLLMGSRDEEKGNKLRQIKTKTDVKNVITSFHIFKNLNKRLNMFSVDMRFIKQIKSLEKKIIILEM